MTVAVRSCTPVAVWRMSWVPAVHLPHHPRRPRNSPHGRHPPPRKPQPAHNPGNQLTPGTHRGLWRRSRHTGGVAPRIDTAVKWRRCEAASMGRRPGHPSDRNPSRRQRARGTPLSTGRPGPSWVQPPASRGPDRCPSPAAPGTQAGHAESPPHAAGLGRFDRSGRQPGAGLRSNLPLIPAMSTPPR